MGVKVTAKGQVGAKDQVAKEEVLANLPTHLTV